MNSIKTDEELVNYAEKIITDNDMIQMVMADPEAKPGLTVGKLVIKSDCLIYYLAEKRGIRLGNNCPKLPRQLQEIIMADKIDLAKLCNMMANMENLEQSFIKDTKLYTSLFGLSMSLYSRAQLSNSYLNLNSSDKLKVDDEIVKFMISTNDFLDKYIAKYNIISPLLFEYNIILLKKIKSIQTLPHNDKERQTLRETINQLNQANKNLQEKYKILEQSSSTKFNDIIDKIVHIIEDINNIG
jgi:hypothetical protein